MLGVVILTAPQWHVAFTGGAGSEDIADVVIVEIVVSDIIFVDIVVQIVVIEVAVEEARNGQR